jgi:hypothetical protein
MFHVLNLAPTWLVWAAAVADAVLFYVTVRGRS